MEMDFSEIINEVVNGFFQIRDSGPALDSGEHDMKLWVPQKARNSLTS
jgi:hypothetical protein